MNKIFEKNVNLLKDIDLVKILQNHKYDKIPVLINTNGYNINYDNKLLHSAENPFAESLNIYKSLGETINNDTIIVIYGLGLGYLLQIASQNTNSQIIVYEPNLDILFNTFTLVDFSSDLSKDNIILFNNFDKLIRYVSNITNPNSNVEILSLASYREMYESVFKDQTKKLELAFGSTLIDFGFKKNKLYSTAINLFQNLPDLLKETPINCYEGIYKNKTAVIVSAGPTLSENIETLKKYQNNVVIFSVGPAMKTLVSNNIKVDYLCIIESLNCSKQVQGIDLSNINMIVEPYTNPNIHSLKTNKKLIHLPSNMPASEYWGDIIDIKTDKYNTQGTVSFAALDCAVNMGFSKIILVGQDLAYIDGQCYSKNSVYEDLICKYNSETKKYEIIANDFEKYANHISSSDDENIRNTVAKERLNTLNSTLYTVKGINGNFIPTEAGYATFIQHFTNYANNISDVELINTSLKGAQIDGFKNISLDEALKDEKYFDKKDIDIKYQYDIDKIKTKLNKDVDYLNNILNIIEDCLKKISRLKMEFKRNKDIDKDKLLGIRFLIEKYTEINSGNSSSNKLFSIITAKDKIDIDLFINQVTKYDFENSLKVVNKFYEYYINIKDTLNNVILIIKTSVESIK